ncbi:hypothetical protein ACSU6B_22675 [Neobacillus sp. C211]|uniref:hypothetical protein n=1 Tax=unclassified Neobacillus TaxID=2675272 RepID=UPI00397B0E31
MLKIENMNLLTDISPEFSFLDLEYITDIRYFIEFDNIALFDERNRTNVDMTFIYDPKEAQRFEVKIRFNRVENFEMIAGGTVIQLSGLEVVDFRDKSWENIKFQVRGFENRDIDFYCNNIEILEVNESQLIDKLW